MQLPSTWRVARLEELQRQEPRAITDGPFGSHLTSAHYTQSGPRVVRLQNIGDGQFVDAKAHISESHFESMRQHEVKPGDLLVASLGEVLPRACLAPDWLGPAIVKADCIRVRLADNVDKRWVLYALQEPTVRRWADEHRHGVGRPRLGLKVIRDLPIPLPDLKEQRRIVDILEDHLSRLDAGQNYLRAALARQQRLTNGLLAAEYRVQPGEAVAALLPAEGIDESGIPSIPASWSWRRLADLADVAGGVTKDSKRQSDPAMVEVPYLRVANVQRGRLDLSRITTIRVPPSQAAALRLQIGDVLLNEGGDRDKLGRGWVWQGQIEDCIHQNHVFRARVRGDAIDPELLSHAANTIGGQWCQRNGAQSVNLASISLRKIRLMPVPVPPRSEQHAIAQRIAERHAACRNLEISLGMAQTRCDAIRRALLAAAFSGRLTGGARDVEIAEETAALMPRP